MFFLLSDNSTVVTHTLSDHWKTQMTGMVEWVHAATEDKIDNALLAKLFGAACMTAERGRNLIQA